jgi:hypothetical protein
MRITLYLTQNECRNYLSMIQYVYIKKKKIQYVNFRPKIQQKVQNFFFGENEIEYK